MVARCLDRIKNIGVPNKWYKYNYSYNLIMLHPGTLNREHEKPQVRHCLPPSNSSQKKTYV